MNFSFQRNFRYINIKILWKKKGICRITDLHLHPDMRWDWKSTDNLADEALLRGQVCHLICSRGNELQNRFIAYMTCLYTCTSQSLTEFRTIPCSVHYWRCGGQTARSSDTSDHLKSGHEGINSVESNHLLSLGYIMEMSDIFFFFEFKSSSMKN